VVAFLRIYQEFVAIRSLLATVRRVSSKTSVPPKSQRSSSRTKSPSTTPTLSKVATQKVSRVTKNSPRPQVLVAMANNFCRNGVLATLSQLHGYIDVIVLDSPLSAPTADVVITTPDHAPALDGHPHVLVIADLKHLGHNPLLVIEQPEQLIDALRAFICTETAPASLNAREVEILTLVAHGASTNEIAATIFMSPDTVKTYLARIYRKLGVNDRAAAIYLAVSTGLLVTARTAAIA